MNGGFSLGATHCRLMLAGANAMPSVRSVIAQYLDRLFQRNLTPIARRQKQHIGDSKSGMPSPPGRICGKHELSVSPATGIACVTKSVTEVITAA